MSDDLIKKIDGVLSGRLIPMDLTDEDFKEIRRRLQPPMVSREFVEKWLPRFGQFVDYNYQAIKEMLAELGYGVEP